MPTPKKLLAILVIVLGSYFLNITDVKNGLLAPFKRLLSDKGLKLAFLANFLWAVTPIFQKQAIFETTPTMPLSASFAGVIFVTILVTPYLFGAFFFREKRISERLLGTSIMIAGTLLLVL